MPFLLPCAACGRHTLSTDATCPHCGEPSGASSVVARSTAAAMLGLATACTGPTTSTDDTGHGQVDYGSGDTMDTMDSADSGDES